MGAMPQMARKMVDAGNQPAWGLLPPGLDGGTPYRPTWAETTQAARRQQARALLAEAGYGPERPLQFEIRFNSSTEHRRAAVAMATMLPSVTPVTVAKAVFFPWPRA